MMMAGIWLSGLKRAGMAVVHARIVFVIRFGPALIVGLMVSLYTFIGLGFSIWVDGSLCVCGFLPSHLV